MGLLVQDDDIAVDEAHPGPVGEGLSTHGEDRYRPSRRLVCILGIAALVASVAGTAWWLQRPETLPDGVAARVGEHQITQSALEERVQVMKALYGLQQPSGGEELDRFWRDAAKSAVVASLIDDAAADRGIEIADKAADGMLAKLIRQGYPEGGRDAFVQALGTMGATQDQVVEELVDQAKVARLFDSVTAEVEVTDADVEAAFEERREALAVPERRVIRNIVVASRAQATAVMRELHGGASFPAVARRSSIDASTSERGGLLGTATSDQLDGAYGDAAFAAAPGQAFGPVRTETGWHVGVVERVLPSEPATFAQVSDELRQTLLTERSIEVWRGWLKKTLEDADVIYADRYRPADPTGVPDLEPTVGGGVPAQ